MICFHQLAEDMPNHVEAHNKVFPLPMLKKFFPLLVVKHEEMHIALCIHQWEDRTS